MSTALLYSGGKDSSACLELLRPNWPELLVVSWRPKDMHADVADRLERVAAVVPHFVSVFSYPESWIAEHGYPSNIVPVPSCSAGRRLGFEPSVRISPWTDCCAANFWGRSTPSSGPSASPKSSLASRLATARTDQRPNPASDGGRSPFTPRSGNGPTPMLRPTSLTKSSACCLATPRVVSAALRVASALPTSVVKALRPGLGCGIMTPRGTRSSPSVFGRSRGPFWTRFKGKGHGAAKATGDPHALVKSLSPVLKCGHDGCP